MSSTLPQDARVTAVGLFAEAYAGLTARFAAQFADHGLASIEFEVLVRLARSAQSQLRMTDLAAQTGLTTSGVTRVVDRMERAGLLGRQACPSDRRSSYAVLSGAGRERLDQVLPGHLALIDQWLTGQLDPAELDALLGALRKIRDAVRPCATAGAEQLMGACQPEEPVLPGQPAEVPAEPREASEQTTPKAADR